MNLNITTRHFELTEGLKKEIEGKISKLSKYFDRLLETRVILNLEKSRHLAEITVHMPNGIRLAAKAVAQDMYLAFDQAAKKIEIQTKKYKEKLKLHKQKFITE
ncbi:MAG: ribosome-associated translation inhibitor RaiA [Candidatus Edwardsbacteria bacterium]